MKKILLTTLCFFALISVRAQSDERVLFSVDGNPVSVTEFLTVYNKNNFNQQKASAADMREYLDLYVKFKLKVREAYNRGLDTSEKFRKEFENYRNQLAQPYLRDRETSQTLVQEAYKRMQEEVRASHIMVKIEENAAPKDSLAAFKKINDIYQRLQKGEDFNTLAQQVSEDPSAQENQGDLGYFSAFRMIYPFEEMAYTTAVGQYSKPFRTQFGYHILKVHDRRPAAGEIRVAHLLLLTRNTDSDSMRENTRKRIFEIHKKIKNGENFEALVAQYSEDPSTAQQQGVLPWFGTGRMVPMFEATAFALARDGDISEPVQTPYGWHIIKRLERRGVPEFDKVKGEIESKVNRDSRANLYRSNLIEKLKQAYNFKENTKNLESLLKEVVDSLYRQGNWKADSNRKKDEVVATFADQKLTQKDLSFYLQSNQFGIGNSDLRIYLLKQYQRWLEEKLLAYEDSRLEQKYPEFKALLNEYREGILLFDLTDQLVWSRAVNDTDGLQNWYNQNNNNYQWGERAEVTIYQFLNAEQAAKGRKLLKKKKNTDDIIAKTLNESNPLNVRITSGKFEKGGHAVVDKTEWKKGLSNDIQHNNAVFIVKTEAILPPGPKKLDEIRGLATSDYQNYLEKSWLEELNNRYKVVINEETLNSILPK
jgi:peptidyl-prolyl cis-trans isomerase SurA